MQRITPGLERAVRAGTEWIFGGAITRAKATSEKDRQKRLASIIVTWLELIVAVLLLIMILAVFDRFQPISLVPFMALIFTQVAMGMAVWADHHRPTIIIIAAINAMVIIVGLFAFILQIIELVKCSSSNRTQGTCYDQVVITLEGGGTIIQCVAICPSTTEAAFQLVFVIVLVALSLTQTVITGLLLRDHREIDIAKKFLVKMEESGSPEDIEKAARRVVEAEESVGAEDDDIMALKSLEREYNHPDIGPRSRQYYSPERMQSVPHFNSHDHTGQDRGSISSPVGYMTKYSARSGSSKTSRHHNLHHNSHERNFGSDVRTNASGFLDNSRDEFA